MIQILGLRDYQSPDGKIKKKEVFFSRGWRLESVKDVFNPEKLAKILAQIPEGEQFNLYFTQADCFEERGRKLKEQWVIPFDIDNLELSPGEELIIAEKAARAACHALGVPYEAVSVCFSGNGVQLFIHTDKPITDEDYFDQTRECYSVLAKKVQDYLINQGFICKIDSTVWSKGRLMRLPNTLNKKPKRPTRMAQVINPGGITISYDVEEKSGVQALRVHEHIDMGVLKTYPKPDVKAVCAECAFLKWCSTNQDKVSEPQWYAGLSIWARLDDTGAIAHAASEKHPDYSHYETENKIAQARAAAGPRTCRNIESLWDGCKDCAHYEKVSSPILIKGPTYIRTKDTGFRNVKDDGTPGKVDFEDLIKAFGLENEFKTIIENGSTIRFNGKHWEHVEHNVLRGWMRSKVHPAPSVADMAEFLGRVTVENLVRLEDFVKTREGLMNFQNCVVNVQTGEVLSHSPDYGFFDVRPYPYDPHATCPTWDKFLLDITGGDHEIATVLSEFGGYAISGDSCWLQKALILLGEGSNGKSVFMETLGAVVGDQHHTAIPMQELSKDTVRFRLMHKLFNYSEETSVRSLMDSNIFKTLTNGGKVTIKQLYYQPYEAAPGAKLIMSANEPPTSEDKTHAFFRRLVIIKLEQVFTPGDGKHDPFIHEKLRKELPGICNALLRDYYKMKERGSFTATEKLENTLRLYREDADPLIGFIAEECADADEATFITAKELYSAYVNHCKAYGHREQSIIGFGRGFTRHTGKKSLVRRDMGGVIRVYPGVTLNKAY